METKAKKMPGDVPCSMFRLGWFSNSFLGEGISRYYLDFCFVFVYEMYVCIHDIYIYLSHWYTSMHIFSFFDVQLLPQNLTY